MTAIAAVDLRMPNGDAPTAVLHVSHEGVVQVLSATRCRVVRGEFTVDGSLAVELAGSRHTIALDARSKVTLNVVREPTSMDDTRVAEELAAGTLPPADVVHLEVVAGEVRLLPDGTALHVGDRVEFQPNAKPVIDFALQPDDLVKVDDWLRQLQITDASIDIKTADGIKTSKARIKAHADLMDFLGQSARRWTELGTRVGDVIAARPANDVRGRLYAVLAQDPDPRTHRRLLSKMLNEPAQLGSRAVVILADRPASPGDPERDWTAQVYEVLRGASRRGELPLLPAVWLTLHGDRRGLAVVRNLSRMPIMVRAKPEMYLGSVLALSRMGESTVWSDARDVAEREVDSYLRDGDLQRARSLCLKVAWFHGYLESERPPAVGDIERRLDVMVRGRTNELGHAAAIRRRMAELTH